MLYHPSIVAQNFATLACLNPDQAFLGVGTGEAINETPATVGEGERAFRVISAREPKLRPSSFRTG
jgi:coenzyme F420-dependent glucose-6-phosphate dehydrogenase